jgi:hypothetical protein
MDALERRWRRAHDAATGARADFDALQAELGATDPKVRAAELLLRKAEQRKREIMEEIESLEDASVDAD